MSDNTNITIKYLAHLGLSVDEARLYMELLKAPNTHLELARSTGINRTKVYRLVDELEKRSLITTRTDDRGVRLVANDPAALEISVISSEERLAAKKYAYSQVLPVLHNIQQSRTRGQESFTVQTYDGVDGFKQMLWHELKADGEILIFGSGMLSDLVDSQRWSERHRTKSIEAGYTIRELLNPGKKDPDFTSVTDYKSIYNQRYIPESVLMMEHQTCIYNDTVATYCWRGDQKVGVEVTNRANADMMRQVFELYWLQSADTPL